MKRLKVYLETSFVSYLTGRPTTKEPIASAQAVTRQWWAAVAPSCDLFVSEHVWNEIQDGSAADVARREEIIREIPSLNGGLKKIVEVAATLRREHAIPEKEVTDSYHIATAAYYGMDVLLTWNCRHMANDFALPKIYGVLYHLGMKIPVLITPSRFIECDNVGSVPSPDEAEDLLRVKLCYVNPKDAVVNGCRDSETEPEIPGYDKSDKESIKWNVDVENGVILNWKVGTKAQTNYKVVDNFEYDFKGFHYVGYVPDFMGIDDESFGDYVCVTVDENGKILNWNKEKFLSENAENIKDQRQ